MGLSGAEDGSREPRARADQGVYEQIKDLQAAKAKAPFKSVADVDNQIK